MKVLSLSNSGKWRFRLGSPSLKIIQHEYQTWWALENVSPFKYGVSFSIYVTFRGFKRSLLAFGASTFVRRFWWDFWQKNYGWFLMIWLDLKWMVDEKGVGLVLSSFERFETQSPFKQPYNISDINEFSLGVFTKIYPQDFRSRSWEASQSWGTAAVNACGNAGRWEQALQLVEDLRWDSWMMARGEVFEKIHQPCLKRFTSHCF